MRRLFVLAAFASLVACHKEPSRAEPEPTPVVPAPAPANMVAEVVMRGPDALWGRLQQGVGGPLGHLPGTFAAMLAATAGLDLPVAAEVDGASAAVALVARSDDTLGFAVALRLRDLRHARASLLEGKAPVYTGKSLDGAMTLLEPTKPAASRYPTALSSLGYAVIARSEGDLVAYAPYLTRTLAQRSPGPHALVISAPHDALAGPVKDVLVRAWAIARRTAVSLEESLRKEHGGRKPDFGDPAAVMDTLDGAVEKSLALVADLDRASLTLDAGDSNVDIELTMTPGFTVGPSARAFAAMATRDASPLLTLSRDTAAAVVVNDDPTSRKEAAEETASRASLILGPTLDAKGRGKVLDAFSSWAAARGNWMTVGLELDGPPALTLRTPVSDGDSADQSVEKFVDLASLPGVQSMLMARVGVKSVSTATASVAGGGSTSIATFQRVDPAKGHDPAVAWAVTGDLLHVALAESAAQALRASREPDHLLGTDVALASKLGALRDRSSLVVVLRPALDDERADARPSAVLGLGRDKLNGWGLLEADDELVRAALSRAMEP